MDETEFEVAEILLELRRLISESKFCRRFSFTWGTKRRRSSKAETPTLPSSRLSSLQSPPSVPQPVAVVGPTCETEKPKALSPATPLLFSPTSESDDKSKNSKRKVSLKRKKEECLRKIAELSERKDFFKEEIKNVQRYYDQQKVLNLKLKARKQMLILGGQKEQSQIQPSLNYAMELAQPIVQIGIQDQHEQSSYIVHHTSFIMECMADASGLGRVGSFDLNLLPEECSGIECGQTHNLVVADKSKSEMRALAAQARHRRIQICRSKNANVGSKLRYPICR